MAAFTERYTAHLLDHYDPYFVDQITDESLWEHAPVPGMPEETVPYAVVYPRAADANGEQILYVPGFGEGIVNKASTAAEWAKRGYEVYLPGQNRAAVAKSERTGKTLTEFQADNYLSVMEHAGFMDDAPTIYAKSYGGLVFNAMSRLSRERDGYNPFENSTVFLGASAGLIDDETKGRLFVGWARMIVSEMDKKNQDFPDIDGSTGKASMSVLSANWSRTLGEVKHLAADKIDPMLPHYVGRLVVFDYADDKLFPASRTSSHVRKLIENGAVWVTPYSLADHQLDDGSVVKRGGRGAVHDDEQLNPSRVAGAIDRSISDQSVRLNLPEINWSYDS